MAALVCGWLAANAFLYADAAVRPRSRPVAAPILADLRGELDTLARAVDHEHDPKRREAAENIRVADAWLARLTEATVDR